MTPKSRASLLRGHSSPTIYGTSIRELEFGFFDNAAVITLDGTWFLSILLLVSKNMKSSRISSAQWLSFLVALPLTAAAQTSMKAIVIHQNGGPEVLKYEDATRPQPKDDEILIRVVAAAVNPVDVAIREGRFGGGGGFPFIPGMDVAGVVEQAGTRVTRFKNGDAVYAYLSFEEQGGYAEFVVTKEDHAALKPKSIDFEHASGRASRSPDQCCTVPSARCFDTGFRRTKRMGTLQGTPRDACHQGED